MADLTVSANVDTFLQSADFAAMKDVMGLGTADSPTFAGIRAASIDFDDYNLFDSLTSVQTRLRTYHGFRVAQYSTSTQAALTLGRQLLTGDFLSCDSTDANNLSLLKYFAITSSGGMQTYGAYTDASNYVRGSLSATTSAITLAAQVGGTHASDNVDIVLTPTGTGVIDIGVGNTTSGAKAICVASASNCNVEGSSVMGADGSSASGIYSLVAGGRYNDASGQYSFSSGYYARALIWGQRAHGAGVFANSGDAQAVSFVARIKTTDATPATLMLDGASARLTVPSGRMLFADINVSGIKSDGSALAAYKRKVAIKNVGGTTSLVGSVETIGTDIEDNASCDVAITADDTNDALQINVTGVAAETWRWVATVEGIEIGYGT